MNLSYVSMQSLVIKEQYVFIHISNFASVLKKSLLGMFVKAIWMKNTPLQT